MYKRQEQDLREKASVDGLTGALNRKAAEQKINTLMPVSYTHLDVYKRQLPGITWRKAGMTSNHHAPYDLGYTRATMA